MNFAKIAVSSLRQSAAEGPAAAARQEGAIYTDGRRIIFAVLFALYVIEHHFYQFGGFYGDLSSYVLLALAFLFLIFPGSYAFFFVVAVAHLVQTVTHLPTGSNHNLLSLFVTAGLVAAYFHVAWSARTLNVAPARHFEAFVPLGRWVLLIMYFYGTFHKINTDFLNPASSCAVVFWHRYGFPELLDRAPVVHAMTMYGTLVLEATIIAMLLSRRFRWWGILLGICFHAFLAFQPGGWFRAFSILAIALHSLFLPADALSRFANSPFGRTFLEFFAPVGRRILYGIIALTGWVVVWKISPHQYQWALIIGAILAFVYAYGREPARQAVPIGRWLRTPSPAIGTLALVFFLNGLSPYVGFKTGQTISMFSNITTEGGQSNHLIMPNIPLFEHQSRIATVVETDHPAFVQLNAQGYQMVEYQLLDILERSPDFSVLYEVNGQQYLHSPDRPLAALSDLSPRWVRNLLSFKPVNLESPRRCDRF